jgi:hypothetical protein
MSTPAPTRPDIGRLDQMAVRLLDAILDSASVDLIGVSNWWDRARTALETGAAAAVDYPTLISAMARKLQISYALSPATSKTVAAVGAELADNPGLLPALRDHCRRNAVYIVALVRLARQGRQAEKKALRDAGKPSKTSSVEPEGLFA